VWEPVGSPQQARDASAVACRRAVTGGGTKTRLLGRACIVAGSSGIDDGDDGDDGDDVDEQRAAV